MISSQAGLPPNDALKLAPQTYAGRLVSLLDNPRFFYGIVIFIYILYLIADLARAYYHQWNVNPDAVSYLQIAKQYAAGDFVVRGYWSPLISWLTALLMKVGVSPELAIRYVVSLCGCACMGLSMSLGTLFGLHRAARIMLAILVAILIASIPTMNADIIGSALLLAYFRVIHDPRVLRFPIRFGALAGLAAGAAYFARSYNLTFIVAHLVIYSGWLWFQTRSFKPVLRFVPVLLVVMGVVASPWILLLSQRYERLTFSTSALHTRGLVAPDAQGVDSIVCINGERLCDQPEDVLFPWEDHPAEIQPDYNWSPFASSALFQHQLQLILSNLRYIVNLNLLWAMGGVCCVLYVIFQRNSAAHRKVVIYWLLTAGLYVAGYLLTLSTGGIRYFLIPYMLLFMMFLLMIQTLSEHTAGLHRYLLLASVGILILISFNNSIRWVVGNVRRTIQGLEQVNLCIPVDAQAMNASIIPPFAGIGGNWRLSMEAAYYTGKRSMGYLHPDKLSLDEINQQLQQSGVRTILVFDELEAVRELPLRFGYRETAHISFCKGQYTVFEIPSD